LLSAVGCWVLVRGLRFRLRWLLLLMRSRNFSSLDQEVRDGTKRKQEHRGHHTIEPPLTLGVALCTIESIASKDRPGQSNAGSRDKQQNAHNDVHSMLDLCGASNGYREGHKHCIQTRGDCDETRNNSKGLTSCKPAGKVGRKVWRTRAIIVFHALSHLTELPQSIILGKTSGPLALVKSSPGVGRGSNNK